MKKKMIAVAVLLVAVVVTASQVAGTYAKYTSTGTIKSDTARVAKWNIDLTNTSMFHDTLDLFKESYTTGVQSAGGDVIAPGAYGKASLTVGYGTNAPEVDYQIKATATVTDLTEKLHFAVVNNTSEKTITATGGEGEAFEGEGTVANYTLSKDDLAKVIQFILSGNITGTSETINAGETIANKDTSYTIYWMWDFDDSGSGTYDVADTELGNGEYTTQTAAKIEVTVTATQTKK